MLLNGTVCGKLQRVSTIQHHKQQTLHCCEKGNWLENFLIDRLMMVQLLQPKLVHDNNENDKKGEVANHIFHTTSAPFNMYEQRINVHLNPPAHLCLHRRCYLRSI